MQTGYKVVRKNLVLAIGPELDHHEAQKIKLITDQQLRRGKAKNIVLDFENTGFMDSAGIGMIIGRYKETNLRGGKVCIIHADNAIRKLIRISGLYKLIYEYENLEEALEHL